MYYLKHSLIRALSDIKREAQPSVLYLIKHELASVLNSLKNYPFYTHLVTLFTKEFSV